MKVSNIATLVDHHHTISTSEYRTTMTNSEFVDKYRVVPRHTFAIHDNANNGVNRMKFITLAPVPYILPFVPNIN